MDQKNEKYINTHLHSQNKLLKQTTEQSVDS